MLYASAPTTSDFPKTADLLAQCGASAHDISVMREYFDISKPRNNVLLDTLTGGADLTVVRSNPHYREEIKAAESEELEERYVLFHFAVGGTSARNYVLESYYRRTKYKDRKADVIRVLADYFQDDAEPLFYASNYDTLLHARYLFDVDGFSGISPEHQLRAVELARSASAKGSMLGTFFTFADPEKTDGKDPLVARALSLLQALWETRDKLIPEELACLNLVLAFAAPFDADCLNRFHSLPDKGKVTALSSIVGNPIYFPAYLRALLSDTEISADCMCACICLIGVNPAAHEGDTLQLLAKRYPELYLKAAGKCRSADNAVKMLEVYAEIYPDKSTEDVFNALRSRSREELTELLAQANPDFAAQTAAYLKGETGIAELLAILPQLESWAYWMREIRCNVNYGKAFGYDEFAERCITYELLVNRNDYPYEHINALFSREKDGWQDTVEQILYRQQVPPALLLDCCGILADGKPKWIDQMIASCRKFGFDLKAIDSKALSVPGRCLYAQLCQLSGETEQLVALTNDGSKVVRALLVELLPAEADIILPLLTAKKGAKRKIAAQLLRRHFPESIRPQVQEAFEAEKTAAIQKQLAEVLGSAVPEQAAEVLSADLVENLTKGNKAKKVAWLFADPFAPVHKKDGSEAEEAYLQALCLCYANAAAQERSPAADTLAADLNTEELEQFAIAVFGKWMNNGAPAKSKWVLVLTAVHGGSPAIDLLLHHIREWADNARHAIAGEAAGALALNGSSAALMAVDNLSRKCKNRHVRAAAGMALQRAADALGITREELADKIVPDLGFDEKLCRVFDFGERQFQVYLTPALELEIFEGEKRLKNLPKPGAKDDPEKSAAAVKDFKEMKKQMKAAIQSQRQRLEYVLLCDRKWTADSWRDLFIRKPVMHCFAIGLIWGVYENGKLVQSFRYMEDGTFNTADEEEYTLPEQAVIGLVHPLELDEELLAAWQEQLSDYEIAQPFPQLSRPVSRLADGEAEQTALTRFKGRKLNDLSLLGRMTKLGWDKGQAQDAGFFYEFVRTDISRQEKAADGSVVRSGYHTELKFSGMYIGVGGYGQDMEEVELEEVVFYTPDSRTALKLEDVDPRYLSEIIAQLDSISEETTEEKEA